MLNRYNPSVEHHLGGGSPEKERGGGGGILACGKSERYSRVKKGEEPFVRRGEDMTIPISPRPMGKREKGKGNGNVIDSHRGDTSLLSARHNPQGGKDALSRKH